MKAKGLIFIQKKCFHISVKLKICTFDKTFSQKSGRTQSLN